MTASPGRGRFNLTPLAQQDQPADAPAPLRPIAELLEDAQRIVQKELSNMQARSRTGMILPTDMATLGAMIRALKAIEAKIGDAGEADPESLTVEQLRAIASRKK